jgi:Ca2+-binding EF-hand superfamily protein
MAEGKDKPKERWTFERSIFSEYTKDADKRFDDCFDRDWSQSRMAQLLKSSETRGELRGFLKPRYLNIMLTFWVSALATFDSRAAVGVSMMGLRDLLVALGGVGPGKLIDGKNCQLSDSDCIFVAANVIGKELKSQLKILPERGLARFQFLETIARLAFRRFLTKTANQSSTQDCFYAADQFFSFTAIGEELVNLRRSLCEALFTEECCHTYREHIDTLKGVFDGYKTICSYPGRSGKNISYGSWLELLADADVLSEDFPMRKCSTAFTIAKEMHVDVTSDWRHMELSWSEFLVAVGAVVRLQPHWEHDFMADHLDEFLSEHMDIAFSKLMDRPAGKSRSVMRNVDASIQPLITLLHRLFEEADADKSGSVDLREFKWSLNKPEVTEEFTKHGLNVSELDVLFRSFDKDGNGEVTMEEITDGFISYKTSMKGLEKAMAFMRKAFTEADTDGNGSLDLQEFHALLEQSTVMKKLQALGVSPDEIRGLFEIIDQDSTRTVTVEEVIEGFITLRDPKTRCLRGVKVLKQLFEDADADGSGSLDLSEVEDALQRPEVDEKFQSMGLEVPHWSTLFEELDTDGSGDLSWEEIEEGMQSYWSRSAT